MGNKLKFSKFYPTGIMTLIAFFPAVIAMVVISEITKVSYLLFFGIWLVIAIIGEMYNEKRRKRFVAKGGVILPEQPLGKISLVFANFAMFSLIGGLWLMINFVKGVYFDGWLWFALQFFASGVIIFGALTLVFAAISIYRSIKQGGYGHWLAIYSVIIAGIVILVAFLFVFPVINSLNDTLMNLNRDYWEKLDQNEVECQMIKEKP
jgi:hypothetical protein